MENIYGHYNKNASEKIHIKQYFDEYTKAIASANCLPLPTKDEKSILRLMGVDIGEEEATILKEYCSPDNLTVPGECQKIINSRRMKRKDVFDPQKPPDVDLETIQELKGRLKQDTARVLSKFQSELIINHEKTMAGGFQAVPGRDTLIFFRIYHPFRHCSKALPVTQSGTRLLLDNVMAVLGFQTLADLRDKIPCIADYTISKESSDNPEEAIGPMAKDVYKSGFFFIEDTFYNDTRCPTNIDYSSVILNWAKRRPRLGPFKTATMENCRVDSLFARFGFPWLYKHQGTCEHLIVLSEARLINTDDELAVSAYPRIVAISPKSSKLCMICGMFCAKWITLDHERVPHNPCLFCDSCFKSYNYIDGEKVGNFRAYAYPRNMFCEFLQDIAQTNQPDLLNLE